MLVLKLQRPQNSCMQRNQDFADRAFVTECILLHENAYTREHTWSSIREDHVYVCVFLCVCVFRRCMRVVHVQGSVYIRRQNTVAPAHFRFVAVYLKNGKPHRSVAGLMFFVRVQCNCSTGCVPRARGKIDRSLILDTFHRRWSRLNGSIRRNAGCFKKEVAGNLWKL